MSRSLLEGNCKWCHEKKEIDKYGSCLNCKVNRISGNHLTWDKKIKVDTAIYQMESGLNGIIDHRNNRNLNKKGGGENRKL